MVDQQPQAPAGIPSASADVTGAGELALAIRELASAIRETAAFAELEFVPCAESTPNTERADSDDAGHDESPHDGDSDGDGGDGGEPGRGAGSEGRVADNAATILPLVPAPRRGESPSGTPGQAPGETPDGGLCRPGGCGCDRPDPAQGRHARRESDTTGRSAESGVAGAR